MILFAPAYDEPTRCTFRVATSLSLRAAEALLRDQATRGNLHRLLATSDHPLVAFGHGGMRRLVGHNSETALSDDDAAGLSRKAVFAFACNTGTELGRLMAKRGNVWWGYTGLITAPPEEATETGYLVPVFDYLVRGFLALRDGVPERQFFERLKELCTEAADRFDKLSLAGEYVDTGTYHCLLHVWDRLRVWSVGAAEPAHHPDPQSSIYILG